MTYTYLALKWYMSEVENYKKITLGSTEQLFLHIIADEKEKSAYNIYSELNEGKRAYEKQKAKAVEEGVKEILVSSHSTEGMAYKNVHLRIKKLYKLGLIEETGEKQPRRAIKYRITTRGLFQCLLGYPRQVLFSYKDSIILKTILYEFFELETVKELMSIFGNDFFDDYLKKCCEQTLQVFEDIVLQDHKLDKALQKMWPYYYPDQLETTRMDFINDILYREAYNLVYKIVTLSTDMDYEGKFPNMLISKDKKFLGLLQHLKIKFNKGCKNFL